MLLAAHGHHQSIYTPRLEESQLPETDCRNHGFIAISVAALRNGEKTKWQSVAFVMDEGGAHGNGLPRIPGHNVAAVDCCVM